MTKELRLLVTELQAIELWDSDCEREQTRDLISAQAHAARQPLRVVILDKIMELTLQGTNEIHSWKTMPRKTTETAIAALEMRVTAIGMQAERIGRLASQVEDEAHRLELWAVAMGLEEETKAIKECVQLLWNAGSLEKGSDPQERGRRGSNRIRPC